MNTLSLVFLFILASIAAAQPNSMHAPQLSIPNPVEQEAFYRQQRTNLMETKRQLINMINQLRETISKQQLLLNQYYRNQHINRPAA